MKENSRDFLKQALIIRMVDEFNGNFRRLIILKLVYIPVIYQRE
jgi:hypothetical protein